MRQISRCVNTKRCVTLLYSSLTGRDSNGGVFFTGSIFTPDSVNFRWPGGYVGHRKNSKDGDSSTRLVATINDHANRFRFPAHKSPHGHSCVELFRWHWMLGPVLQCAASRHGNKKNYCALLQLIAEVKQQFRHTILRFPTSNITIFLCRGM